MAQKNKLDNYITEDDYLRKQKEAIENAYGNAVANLDAQKQNATINLDAQRQRQERAAMDTARRLAKYIPGIYEERGLGGNVGLTETAAIENRNNYLNSMAGINEAYKNAMTGIDDRYTNAMSGIQTTKDNSLLSLYADAENKRMGKVAEIKETVNSWDGTGDDLDKYIQSNAGYLSESEMSGLNRYADSNRATLNKNAAFNESVDNMKIVTSENVSGVKDEGKLGDNFKIKIGDESFNVEVGDVMSGSLGENILAAAQAKGAGEKSVFKIGNNAYIIIGGAPYKVRARKLDDSTHINNLLNALGGNKKE